MKKNFFIKGIYLKAMPETEHRMHKTELQKGGRGYEKVS